MRDVQVAGSIQELVGQTPVLEIKSFERPQGVRLFAKLEYLNPGGSVKDRLGMALIEAGQQSGQLQPGGTIIEPTAGNTGIGLALAAVGRGYRVIFCVPEKFSQEKQELMRALGAEVVNTPSDQGILGAIDRAKKLAAEIPGAYVPQQFANPANPEVHYRTTGAELWQQLDGLIDVFVAGAGTGGTFTGVARYLKEQNPNVRACIVEPEGSVLRGGTAGPHKTEGIGVEMIYPTLDMSLVDEIYTVSDDHAFAMVKELAAKEGVLAGSSSGAAFWAALREAQNHKPGTNIAVIFPDSSERYLSKQIYRGGI
ncbi:MAG TPA: cysteine synthase A [Symbiobacteriaceae bacterium]|jgi:O-acetylserine dependent cystathionine beta-synthase